MTTGTSSDDSSSDDSRARSRHRSYSRSRARQGRSRSRRNDQLKEQLASINETVKTLQTVVMNSGMFTDKPCSSKTKGKEVVGTGARGTSLPFSSSNTTIYRDLLKQAEQVLEDDVVEQVVDQEISFHFKSKNRDSTIYKHQ